MYNEDLDDEDDSGQDWNEVEDEEDDEIDSDGKKLLECFWENFKHSLFPEEADETAEKVEGAEGGEAEGNWVNLPKLPQT